MKKRTVILSLTFLIFTSLVFAQVPYQTPIFKFSLIPRGYTGDWAGSTTDTTGNRGLNANSLKLEYYFNKIFTPGFSVQPTFIASLGSIGGAETANAVRDSLNASTGKKIIPGRLGTGTPSSSTVLAGDSAWIPFGNMIVGDSTLWNNKLALKINYFDTTSLLAMRWELGGYYARADTSSVLMSKSFGSNTYLPKYTGTGIGLFTFDSLFSIGHLTIGNGLHASNSMIHVNGIVGVPYLLSGYAPDSIAVIRIDNSGTITLSTWNGTTVGAVFGGTGQTNVTAGDLLYGSASNTWGRLSVNATSTMKFLSDSGSGNPTWKQITLNEIANVGTMASQDTSLYALKSLQNPSILSKGYIAADINDTVRNIQLPISIPMDSTYINTTDTCVVYRIPFTAVVDSVVKINFGVAASVVYKILFGNSVSGTWTALNSSPAASTSVTYGDVVTSFDNATITKNQYIAICCTTVTTKPKGANILIYYHITAN